SAVGFSLSVETAINVLLRRPLNVVRNDEIEFSVAVVIDPGCACAELLHTCNARSLRNIRESAITVVVKESALTDCSDENVVVAIVVVVANGDSHSVHADRQSGFLGDVCKRTVAIVVVELQR